jgi:hypothetical protein
MGLMTATGPPPNFLMPLVTGLPLAFVLARTPRAPESAIIPAPKSPAAWFAFGVVAGLAVWNSSLAIPAFAGIALGLLLGEPALRAVFRPGLLPFALGLALGASPLALARAVGAAGTSVVTAASAVTAVRPPEGWGSGLLALGRALVGLLGFEVPLVVDGPERAVLPVLLRASLALGLLVLLVLGAPARKALPFLGWAGALCGAFAFSRRTGPDELRYLYGILAPVLVLLGLGLARALAWRAPAAAALALAILVPWQAGHRLVAAAWRDPAHATKIWQVPPLEPVIDSLGRAGVKSAYASLQFAGRLALETGERVLVSQAWNERIPGDPLRFRDEVDLDPAAAWVLHPHLSRGLPRAAGFRELLREMGGAWREDAAGELVVFRAFRPPYDEARPVPRTELGVFDLEGHALPAAVQDRDPRTAWTSPLGLRPGAGLEIRLAAPRPLDALVLAVEVNASPLAVPWVAEVDGALVSRGPRRHGLQWVNGAPRAALQALLAVPLGGREARQVRILFQGAGPPLRVLEAFVYGPDETEQEAAGREASRAALQAARSGQWTEAVRLYAEALRQEPDRASHHAAWLRASWRDAHRQRLDVESLTDGGPDLVGIR